MLLFFNDNCSIRKAQAAFYQECHDIGAFFGRCDCIKVNVILFTRVQFRKFNAVRRSHFRSTVEFKVKPGPECFLSCIYNRPLDIKRFVGADDLIIKWSAVDGVTGIIRLSASSTATTSTSAGYNRRRSEHDCGYCRKNRCRGGESTHFRLSWKRGIRRLRNKSWSSLSQCILRGDRQRDRSRDLVGSITRILGRLGGLTGREQNDHCHCKEQDVFLR